MLWGTSVSGEKHLMLRVESQYVFFCLFWIYMWCSEEKMGTSKIYNSSDAPMKKDIFTALDLRNHILGSQTARRNDESFTFPPAYRSEPEIFWLANGHRVV